jgi:uncharacterized protein
VTRLEIFALIVTAIASFGMSYLGAAVGLVLGHFRLALLTYVLGSAVAGTATSVAISTVSTVSGAVGHARGGRVQLAPLLLIGAPSALAAYVAASFAGRIDARFLKGSIAAVLLVAGVDMIRRRAALPVTASGPGPSVAPPPHGSRVVTFGAQILLGAVLGAISGLVGLLLGSLRLPSMIRLGLKPSTAVGTNMAIGAVTGSSAAISALAGGKINLLALAVVAPLALLGAHFGSRRTAKLDPATLKRWIAGALLLTAAIMLVDLATTRA